MLPESLGGGDWAILPSGLFCDSCQNAFGSAIEQQALADYPFSMLRVFLGITTKKGKAPWFDCWEGKILAASPIGCFGYEPSPPFAEVFNERRKTVMRIPAEPRKPAFICRTLLKMGLELVASTNPNDAFSDRLDEARSFALHGVKDVPWWYLQAEHNDRFTRLLSGTAEPADYSISLETIAIEDDAEVFYLKLFHLEMFCPLDSRILPPRMGELEEPAFRLFAI